MEAPPVLRLQLLQLGDAEHHQRHLDEQRRDSHGEGDEDARQRFPLEDAAPQEVARDEAEEHEGDHAEAEGEGELAFLMSVSPFEIALVGEAGDIARQLVVGAAFCPGFASLDSDCVRFLPSFLLLFCLRFDLVLVNKCSL